MAKSRSIGGIYASLSLRDGGFKSGLKSARKSMDSFADTAMKAGGAAILAAPVAAFAGIVVSMKSAIDAGGELNDMMARTGAGGEGLFVMQKAFENAGMAASQVPSALNKMQKALAGVNEEGDPTNQAFVKLGLSVSDLIAIDPVDAFKKIQASISAIENPAQRTAVAMQLFGKSGGEMLAVLTDSSAFAQAAEQVGGLGKTLADNAAKLDAVGDAYGQLGTKMQQLGAEVAVALLPQMEKLAESLNAADLAAIGTGIGDVVTKTSEWASALAEVAKYMPLVAGINWGAEKLFGGAPDASAAKKMADEWARNDPQHGISQKPGMGVENPWANLPVPDDSASIRWFKNGGFAEAMREVNGYPTPSVGVPPMIADPYANFTTEIPDWLKRVEPEIAPKAELSSRERDVNDYQRRGLSLGGNTSAVSSEQIKQTKIMTEMRDGIKRIADGDRPPSF